MDCGADDCERAAAAKGWCVMHYNRWRRTGNPNKAQRMVPRGSSLRDRLDLLVDRSGGPDTCHPFTGTIHHDRYGVLTFEGVQRGAHVWAFLDAGGVLTEDKPFVLHSCDNEPCCNARHLRAGSGQDNMDDKVERARQARHPGETNPAAKLTEEQVVAIRATRGATLDVLAAAYGVSRSTIHLIRTGQRWQEMASSTSRLTPPEGNH